MIELLQRLAGVRWRRSGARIRQLAVAGSAVWHADFPRLPDGTRDGVAVRPPTIVLLHGLGASSTSFYPLIPLLRRRYRVVALDLPGFGCSRPPEGRPFLTFPELVDVAERFVARVAPRGAYLAGHSMGGWIATKIAARRPDLVSGLALLNPGGPALRAEDWTDFARMLMAEERGAIEEWLERTFHRAPIGIRLLARDLRRILHGPAVLELMGSLTAEDFLSDEELRGVRCPAVLVWGERDRLTPDGCRSFYLRRLRGIRYEPVRECGHCPQLEFPRRTAEILLGLPLRAPRRPRVLPAPAGGRGIPVPASRMRRGGVVALARAPRE